jgi:hypothetical protein
MRTKRPVITVTVVAFVVTRSAFVAFDAGRSIRGIEEIPVTQRFLQWGHVAEWLRNGLQNRVHQFNSGRGLHISLILLGIFN